MNLTLLWEMTFTFGVRTGEVLIEDSGKPLRQRKGAFVLVLSGTCVLGKASLSPDS